MMFEPSKDWQRDMDAIAPWLRVYPDEDVLANPNLPAMYLSDDAPENIKQIYHQMFPDRAR